MKKLIQILIVCGLVVMMGGTASGQTFQDGLNAYNKKEYKTALDIFKLLAEKGDAPAGFNLGVFYEKGIGVTQDYKESLKWYQFALDRGYEGAKKGINYVKDKIAVKEKESKKKAARDVKVNKLTVKAEQGDSGAQEQLAMILFGTFPIPETTEKWCRLSAEQGSSFSQHCLGALNYEGYAGVTENVKEAIKWFSLAAEQGNVDSQSQLADMYYKNFKGVQVDHKKALKWWKLAAEQGDSDSQYQLGKMYFHGKEVSKSETEAIKWWMLAAKQNNGSAKSMLDLRQSVVKSLEKEKDYKGAFEIHSAFAKNGVAYAQYSVGFQYEYGQGVPKNEKEAMKWYELAANQGIEGAKKQIKKIEEKRLAKAKQEKAKQEKAAKKAAKKAKFKKWMDEAEQYRSGAKELCSDDENPSKCITNTSCVAAALILENPHDDRIKKFKKTAGGGLLSKGSLDKAMKELGKYAKKDESLKKTLLGLAMKCSLGSMF